MVAVLSETAPGGGTTMVTLQLGAEHRGFEAAASQPKAQGVSLDVQAPAEQLPVEA
jgi:hypothetical protein